MEKNKASQDSIKIINRRSFIITSIGLILSFIVSIRLFSLQILNFDFYQKKSVENKVAVKATPPLRGDIFDNEKNLVALNSSLYEFVIYKNLNKENVVNKSKTTGEPPLMNAMSVFFAIKDAIASVHNYNITPIISAPATPEKILMSIKNLG